MQGWVGNGGVDHAGVRGGSCRGGVGHTWLGCVIQGGVCHT